jgi:hypothetical protein
MQSALMTHDSLLMTARNENKIPVTARITV